jgi:hypothetical protein
MAVFWEKDHGDIAHPERIKVVPINPNVLSRNHPVFWDAMAKPLKRRAIREAKALAHG